MSTPISHDRVLELSKLGWPPKRIARELNCTPQTVNRIRTVLGYPRTIHCRVDVARIVKLTNAGWSISRIAETLHCGERTVTRVRRKTGIAKPPSRPVTADELVVAERLFADGCSISEVERTLGRAQGSLGRRFKGRGWTHQEVSEFGGHCSRIAKLERRRA